MPRKAKPSAKPVKRIAKKITVKPESMTAPVVGVDGKTKGHVILPKELFGAKVNNHLLAQSVRVYLANQRMGNAKTKTRGEVEGSTRKIYRQKGTGRARHGAIRAPIFVGGGIVFGPRPRDYSLKIPQNMQRVALASALSSQYRQGNIVIVDGIEALPPKTKQFAAMFVAVGVLKPALLVVGEGDVSTAIRGARNLEGIIILSARNLYPYAVLASRKLIITKDAILPMKKTFVRA